jgi:hypothetical protein
MSKNILRQSKATTFADPSTLTDEQIRSQISAWHTEIEQNDAERQDYINEFAKLKLKEAKGEITLSEKAIMLEYERTIASLNTLIENLKKAIRWYQKELEYRNEVGQASIDSGKQNRTDISSLISLNNQDRVNLKSPRDWTKAELEEAMKAREKAVPQDKAGMLQRERQWFDHYYGNDPVKYDETGKMVQPAPVRSIPQEPVPIKTKDGKDLGEALDRVIGNLPGLTGGTGHALNPPVYNEEKGGWVQFDPTMGGYKKIEAPITPGYHLLDQKKATGPLGSVNGVPVEPGQTGQNRQVIQSDRHLAVMPSEEQVIKGLQAGLNMLSNKQNQSPLPNIPKTTALKEDGIIGPKTSFGLKKALVDHGTSKVSEAAALGQFKETAKKAKASGVENLAGELGATFKPLLGNQKSPKDGFQPEGLALQDTLNDLGAGLKDDGIVGPKTQDAFHQIAKKMDEDELTQRFVDNLGFSF